VADVDHLLALFLFDSSAFAEFAAPAQPVTDDRTVLDFSMPRFIGSGFGLGTFNPRVRQDGNAPYGAVAQRTKWYFEHRRSVLPLLTNLGGEDPETVRSRIDGWAKVQRDRHPWINEREWRRWQPDGVAQ